MDFVSDFVRAQDSEPYNKMVSTVCLNTLILMFFRMEDLQIFVFKQTAWQTDSTRYKRSEALLIVSSIDTISSAKSILLRTCCGCLLLLQRLRTIPSDGKIDDLMA